MISDAHISSIEMQRIDCVASASCIMGKDPCHAKMSAIPPDLNEVASVLAGISPIIDPVTLASALDDRGILGRFSASIGSTNAYNEKYLFEVSPDPINEVSAIGELDFEYFSAGATHAEPSKGVSAEQLSKVWRIDVDVAKRTLDITTQRCKRSDDPTLNRNYSTNDRMLRYKRIHQHFFMDTFFATKKAGKSSRGYTCMQLFVTDKGFVFVVPMRSKSEAPQALKLFAKEVGAPDAIICDAAKEQISKEVRQFCQRMGTTLRVLEENTPWANLAELYIGLIKEAIRKDMKQSDCPLVFWDYCAERRARINNLTATNCSSWKDRTRISQ